MSIKIVKEELSRFLESDTPEVIAIRGKWGIGKTYTWKKILKNQKCLGKIALKRYSYVSLFGVNSLQDLKEALFQNMVSNDLIGKELDLHACSTYLLDSLKSFGRKSSKVASQLVSGLSTYTKSISNITSLLSFVTVRSAIICIDDFERKGDSLSLKEILGTISQLKEERNCKIVLIYNDEYINEERKTYDELKEKVIDAEILYDPLPNESINIVFETNDAISNIIKDSSKNLNIVNIRVLMKIKRFASMLSDVLSNCDARILDQAIKTVTLSCFSFYSKSDDSPEFHWLKTYNMATSYLINEKPEGKNSKESKWCSILQSYGYLGTDKLDLVIHDGVSKGYFNKDDLILEADNLSHLYRKDQDNSYKKAWELFHKNLSANQEEFILNLYDGFIENQKFLSVIDLHSSVITLRKLDRDDLANKLVDSYIQVRKENINDIDLSDSYFLSQLSDKYLIKQFKLAYNQLKKPLVLQEVLQKLSKVHSWSTEEKEYLDSRIANEYENYFESLESPDLKKCIDIILIMDIKNAKEALITIAKKSKINMLRLESYGIKLN